MQKCKAAEDDANTYHDGANSIGIDCVMDNSQLDKKANYQNDQTPQHIRKEMKHGTVKIQIGLLLRGSCVETFLWGGR
jgi:hypothetical protein